MPKSSLPQLKWNLIFIAVACLVIGIDQFSKHLVRTHMFLGQSIPEYGFFRLVYVQNTGAAFSIFHGRTDILTVFSICGAILILFYSFFINRRLPYLDTPLNKIALGFILGGTVGNLIDRFFLGFVTDFLGAGPWPIFNGADSAITVGVITFAISLLLSGMKEEKAKKSPPA